MKMNILKAGELMSQLWVHFMGFVRELLKAYSYTNEQIVDSLPYKYLVF